MNSRKNSPPSVPPATVHPEKQPAKKAGPPGDESSKARDGKPSDARTGHDKDANEQQAKQHQQGSGGRDA